MRELVPIRRVIGGNHAPQCRASASDSLAPYPESRHWVPANIWGDEPRPHSRCDKCAADAESQVAVPGIGDAPDTERRTYVAWTAVPGTAAHDTETAITSRPD